MMDIAIGPSFTFRTWRTFGAYRLLQLVQYFQCLLTGGIKCTGSFRNPAFKRRAHNYELLLNWEGLSVKVHWAKYISAGWCGWYVLREMAGYPSPWSNISDEHHFQNSYKKKSSSFLPVLGELVTGSGITLAGSSTRHEIAGDRQGVEESKRTVFCLAHSGARVALESSSSEPQAYEIGFRGQ